MASLVRRENDDDDGINQPLVPEPKAAASEEEDQETKKLTSRIWIETRKLWRIVGPAIFSRVVSYSMNVITQAFAGHLGEVELAAISIANTVIVGFNFGLLVNYKTTLFLIAES